jgi:formylglycine-generating enzyme required for sulfatase activity
LESHSVRYGDYTSSRGRIQQWVYIPGGEILDGRERSPGMDEVGMKATADLRPIYRVDVDGFFTGKTDVTNSQFTGLAKATTSNGRSPYEFCICLLVIEAKNRDGDLRSTAEVSIAQQKEIRP